MSRIDKSHALLNIDNELSELDETYQRKKGETNLTYTK